MIQKPDFSTLDFSRNPFIVIWEMTRSCALRCVHCRAEAQEARHPEELTSAQAKALLHEIRLFGEPLVVLTGGDPMKRPDVFALIRHAAEIGLRVAVTPSGTGEMTFEKVKMLKDSGCARLAVSLDGSTREIHDGFRKVQGSFDWTMDIIRWAGEAGLPVQINTTITKHNLQDIDRLCGLLKSLNIVLWSVFFLVPVGRGRLEDEVRGRDYERIFDKMHKLSLEASFDIKSTEAPHYRRFVIQRKKQTAAPGDEGLREGSFTWIHSSRQSPEFLRSGKGVNDGNGFVFISHTGEIFPSGFLPMSAGNVKRDSLVNVYRHSDVFKKLRDYDLLKGKCGVCEYKSVCGGSRSRAYAVHGDLMASEPFCVHVPKGYKASEEEKRFW